MAVLIVGIFSFLDRTVTDTPEWNDVKEKLPDTDRWVRAIVKWYDEKKGVKDREVTIWYSKEEYFKADKCWDMVHEWNVFQWRNLREDEPKEYKDVVGDKLEKELFEKHERQDEERYKQK